MRIQKSTSILRDQRGSAILATVAVSAGVLLLIIGAVSRFLPRMESERVNLRQKTLLKLGLSSALDYTKYAIKERWCMTTAWVRDPNCLGLKPALTHPFGLERLLLSEGTLREIEANVKINGAPVPKPILLTKINHTVSFAAFTPLHPLYAAVKDLQSDVEGLKFSIERIVNVDMPTTGREVYLRVRVEEVPSANAKPKGITLTRVEPAYVEQTIALYPREMGSFALAIKGDLILNGSPLGPANANNISLPLFKDKALSGKGLTFLSPIFVNNNVILPDTMKAGAPDTSYNPVTFADTVVLGGGNVYRDGALFAPTTAGGMNDRYYVQETRFGGFLKGVKMDGEADTGLLYLFGTSGAPPDPGLMQKCITRSELKYNLELTRNSVFVVKQASAPTSNNFPMLLGLTASTNPENSAIKYPNEFVPVKKIDVTKQNSPSDFDISGSLIKANDVKITTAPGSTKRPVLKVRIMVGDSAMVANLTSNSKLEVPLNSLTSNDKSNLADVNVVQETINSLKSQQSALASIGSAIALVQTSLDNLAMSTPNTDPKPVSDALTAVGAATGNLTTSQQGSSPPHSGSVSKALSELGNATTELELALTELGSAPPIANAEAKLNQAMSALNKAKTALPADTDYANEITAAQDQIIQANAAQSIQDTTLYFETKPVQGNEIGFTVKLLPSGELQYPLTIEFNAYDFGFSKYGTNYRDAGPPSGPGPNNASLDTRMLAFVPTGASFKSGRTLQAPASLTPDWRMLNGNPVPLDQEAPNPANDLSAVESQCENPSAAPNSSPSFGYADEQDFSKSSRTSWNFRPSPPNQNLLFDASNSVYNPSAGVGPDFEVQSIVPSPYRCIITSSARIVTGFYVCDMLEIQARNTPLEIIGTFIVGGLSVHPTAIQTGIRWSTIYHPQSVYRLRQVGILESLPNSGCDLPAEPIWHPQPSLKLFANVYQCNPISLRSKADPFTWSQVNPVCGLISGSPSTTCNIRYRPAHFNEVELSHKGNL